LLRNADHTGHRTYEHLCAEHADHTKPYSYPHIAGDIGTNPGQVYPMTDDPNSISFLAVGDWGRDGLCCQKDVAIEMSRTAHVLKADFVVSNGDNFYEAGITDDRDYQVITSWENIYAEIDPRTTKIGQLEWYFSLGNHDNRGNPQAQIDLEDTFKGHWHLPGKWYDKVFTKNGVQIHIFFLDTTPFIQIYKQPGWDDKIRNNPYYNVMNDEDVADQIDWLTKGLASDSTSDWKIVVGHHPIWTDGSHYKENESLQEKILPIMQTHGAQIYLCGHDHSMQHHIDETGQVHEFLSGAGSKIDFGTYNNHANFFMTKQGFSVFTITKDTFYTRFVDYESEKLDFGDDKIYRDLSKPIGALNKERLEKFKQRYELMKGNDDPPPFLYGTHYSTPGYVLFYLVRKFPDLMLKLQNGSFDKPERLFSSIADTFDSVLNNPADIKELIPEFYDSDGSFLINSQHLDLAHTNMKLKNRLI
jgi:tartrate-resistant acid phosphatase type 5